ncbi:MAG: hypothetical protein LC795_15485 [Acidobacteria bacterium]|nr:hypothetical protein [Acidobacteriota bacterium]
MKGGRPSPEAMVRAYLVLLNLPPIVTEEMRALLPAEAERERAPERKLKTA